MKEETFLLDSVSEETRLRNYQIVKRFMAQSGPKRKIVRNQLFSEGAKVEIFYTSAGVPLVEDAFRWSEAAANDFPEWAYPETEIFMTQYPDRFLGFTHAVGHDKEREYDSHYYVYFELRDGKISLYREIFNPIHEASSLKEKLGEETYHG